MIGDTGYRFESLDPNHPDDQFLVKIEVVDPATVVFSSDEDGVLTVTEKQPEINDDDAAQKLPAPPVHTDKYRLEPEGDMFRLIALRSIPGIGMYAGARGGLVANAHTLSQYGSCWVHDGAEVRGDVVVTESAQVYNGCRLDGSGRVGDAAILVDVAFAGSGHKEIAGGARLTDVQLSGGCPIAIRGASALEDTHVEAVVEPINLNGCKVRDGHIRNGYEVVSIHSSAWGWLSAYRARGGQLRFSIGCQNRHTREAMLALASEEDVLPVEVNMLKAFFEVVEAAGTGWHGYVPPQPEVKSQHVELTFGGMAQRARDAAQTLRAPQPEQF